jgi:outer membrane lipase/esterase
MRLISKLLCSAVLVSASMAASAYSSLVVFGDSLSDSGNNTALGLGPNQYQAIYGQAQVVTDNTYIPTFTYASGVYSNGPVWATQFAEKMGLSATASRAGGSNYAFGGAQTSFYEPGVSTPSLTMQSQMYLNRSGVPTPADATGLYVVAGGGNNIRATIDAVFALLADPSKTLADAFPLIGAAAVQFAKDIGNIVDNLQGAGAKDIIVWNAPNLGITPAVSSYGLQASGLGTLISQSFNDVLAGRLAIEDSHVKTFDLFGLAGQTAPNTNTTDACGAISGANCSNYLFWDGIHPTTAAHSLIAQNMYVTAVPEPETLVLMVMGIGLIALRARHRAAELQAA